MKMECFHALTCVCYIQETKQNKGYITAICRACVWYNRNESGLSQETPLLCAKLTEWSSFLLSSLLWSSYCQCQVLSVCISDSVSSSSVPKSRRQQNRPHVVFSWCGEVVLMAVPVLGLPDISNLLLPQAARKARRMDMHKRRPSQLPGILSRRNCCQRGHEQKLDGIAWFCTCSHWRRFSTAPGNWAGRRHSNTSPVASCRLHAMQSDTGLLRLRTLVDLWNLRNLWKRQCGQIPTRWPLWWTARVCHSWAFLSVWTQNSSPKWIGSWNACSGGTLNILAGPYSERLIQIRQSHMLIPKPSVFFVATQSCESRGSSRPYTKSFQETAAIPKLECVFEYMSANSRHTKLGFWFNLL